VLELILTCSDSCALSLDLLAALPIRRTRLSGNTELSQRLCLELRGASRFDGTTRLGRPKPDHVRGMNSERVYLSALNMRRCARVQLVPWAITRFASGGTVPWDSTYNGDEHEGGWRGG